MPPPGTGPVSRRKYRRRPLLALSGLTVGLVLAAAAAFGVYGQFMPRTFSAAQRSKIEAWEMARRWRTMPKAALFPARVRYRLPGEQVGANGSLVLTARRLAIARQSTCASVAGASRRVRALLARQGCEAMLRATYADATSSMVLTVGIAVLPTTVAAASLQESLTGGLAGGIGALAGRPLLRPVAVPETPAAGFGVRQRQLSWVVGAGPYLVVGTVGYADGRPRVPVSQDDYTFMEMTSVARGVVDAVAAPLRARPPAPHCPGGPAC